LCRDTPPSRQKREEVTPFSPSSFGNYSEGVGTLRRDGGDLGGGSETLITTQLAYAPDIASCLETTCNDYSRADGFAMMVYETHPADSRVKEMGEVCQTVTSRWGTGGGNVPLVQSIGFTQCDAGRDAGDNISPTLRSGGDGGYPNHSVAYSIREDAQANNFSATPLEVTPALQALRPSVQSHHAQTFVAHAFKVRGGCEGGGKGYLGSDEKAFTLSVTQDQQIAFNVNARPDEMKFEDEISGTLTRSQSAGVMQNMAVRRLTPTECERLQGFPDNYTNIPWRGKPDSPDAPRYKAMGNSMAVPVMAWIGKRIQEVEDGSV
jgi:DNA (cytosine-5)-methyltransferase 1